VPGTAAPGRWDRSPTPRTPRRPVACAASPVVSRDAARAFARAAGLDEERALAWTRVRARAEALEVADADEEWAARLHATADALTG
jgi:hypothetical protein